MRNPSHDERISSYLDDALPEGERTAFEAELNDNAELQQQVADLQQLRADVALLPRYSTTQGFAQRVVAAAVAAKADQDASIAPAASNKPVRLKKIGRGVMAGLAIAASIAVLIISLPWLNWTNEPIKLTHNDPDVPVAGPTAENTAVAAESKPFDIVWSSLPGDDQALVVRIRSPKDFAAGKALREALAEQGISQRTAGDMTTAATQVGKAYRDTLTSTDGSPAADALYLEISKNEFELALDSLVSPEHKIEFVPGQLVAVSQPVGSQGNNTAAGEDAPQVKLAPPAAEFVQELNPRKFKLPKEVAAPSGPVAPHHLDGKTKVRVLVLIEAVP